MSELFKYIYRTFSLADATRITLTIFLLYLVLQEGMYTGIAMSVVYFRFEISTWVERWKREVIGNPEQILHKMSTVLDIMENNEKSG
jgi:hypothetical protein